MKLLLCLLLLPSWAGAITLMDFSRPGPFPLLDLAALAGLCLLVLMTVGLNFSAPNAATGNRKVRERKEDI